MAYADTHAGALADIADAGASVTFTTISAGTYTESTDTFSGGSTATVSGSAIEVKGDPVRYANLGLVQLEPHTLLFAASTYGNDVALGATVTWNSAVFTVKAVDAVSPDGTPIIARVVVSR